MKHRHEISVAVQSDRAASDYASIAEGAEALDFDGLSFYNDLGYQPALFPLMIAAQHTSRLRLGPACLNPYLVHPVEIAGQIASLDLVSRGRAYLGLARGAWLASVGVDQPRPVQTLREAAAIVYRLLAGDASGYAGEIFTISPGTRLGYPALRSDPPLLLGTWGEQTVALAGEVAHEVKLGGCANPAVVPTIARWLRAGAAHAQRSDDAGIVLGAVTVVDDDGRVARALARRQVAPYLSVVGALDPTSPLEPDLVARLDELTRAGRLDDAARLVPADVLERFAFSGTPDEVADHARRCLEAGASRIEFGTPLGTSSIHGLELLGTKVLPGLRALTT